MMCRDRGSVTIWFALAAFVMVVLVGVAVDLSGQVYAQQRAHDLAAQAARSAGEQLDGGQAVRGLSAQADTARAEAAARTYLEASDLDGTVRIADAGQTVEVSVVGVYETKFLSIVGLTRLPVTGTARVRVVRAVGGVER